MEATVQGLGEGWKRKIKILSIDYMTQPEARRMTCTGASDAVQPEMQLQVGRDPTSTSASAAIHPEMQSLTSVQWATTQPPRVPQWATTHQPPRGPQWATTHQPPVLQHTTFKPHIQQNTAYQPYNISQTFQYPIAQYGTFQPPFIQNTTFQDPTIQFESPFTQHLAFQPTSMQHDTLPTCMDRSVAFQEGFNNYSATETNSSNQMSNLDETITIAINKENCDVYQKVYALHGGRKRYLKDCPVEDCSTKQITELSRHLRKVHKMTNTEAAELINNKRLKFPLKTKLKQKLCPIDDCNAFVTRMSQHLKRVHNVFLVKPKIHKRRLEEDADSTALQEQTSSAASLEETSITAPLKETSNTAPFEDTCSITPLEDTGSKPPANHLENDNEHVIFDNKCSYDSTRPIRKTNLDVSSLIIENHEDEYEPPFITELQLLFKNWGDWMRSVDGGRKNITTVKKHVAQMSNFSQIMKPTDFSSFLDKKKIFPILDENVNNGQWKGETARLYLSSFKEFLAFMIDAKPDMLTDGQKLMLNNVLLKIPIWKSNFRSIVKVQKVEKRENQMLMIHDKQKVAKYLQSDTHVHGERLLRKMDKCPTNQAQSLSMSDYTAVTRAIFMTIILNTPKRSGILSEIKLDEYNAGHYDEDKYYIVKVKNHKTATTYGSSILPISPMGKCFIDTYVKKVRKQIACSGSEYLFVKFNGSKYNSSDISFAVKSQWAAAGCGATTPTMFRKSCVSNMYEHDSRYKDSLADLMDHSTETGASHYKLTKREKNAVAAAKYTGKLYELPSKSDNIDSPGTKSHYEKIESSIENSSEGETNPDTASEYQLSNSDDDSNESSSIRKSSSNSNNIKFNKTGLPSLETNSFRRPIKRRNTRQQMTNDQLDRLKKAFKAQIVDGIVLNAEIVKAEKSVKDIVSMYGIPKILNRLAYERRLYRTYELE